MIVLLLSCSISWCQNDSLSLTGDVEQDSILVPISAIRIANAKMIELKYEKEINRNLRECIQTDSILISSLSANLGAYKLDAEAKIIEIKKQRNIAIGAGSGTSLLFLFLFIVAL